MSDLNFFRDMPEQEMGQLVSNSVDFIKAWQLMSDALFTHLSLLAFYARENLSRDDLYRKLTDYSIDVGSSLENDEIVDVLRDMVVALPVHGIDFDDN